MKMAFTAVLLGCSALIAVGASAAEPAAAPARNPVQTAAAPATPAAAPTPGAEAAAPAGAAAANGATPTPRAEAAAPGAAPAGAAGTAGTTTTGQITVQQSSPKIHVREQQATVTVRQSQPEIIVRQPPPVVTVQIPQPNIIVRMPQPQVSVATPPPEVSVSTSKPQVEVQTAKPQVNVTGEQQAANVQMQQARPVVRFEQTGQPRVSVTREGKPKVTYEQIKGSGEAQTANQQAANQQGHGATANEQANEQGAGQQANAEANTAAAAQTANAATAGEQANGAKPAAEKFAKTAYQGGIAEVQMGQLAQQKAGSKDVKKYGEVLVHDHMQANAELKQIAQQQNLTLPNKPGEQAAKEGQKLQDLSGARFDQAFLRQTIDDHKQDIAKFRQEAQSGSDPALKAFAEATIPVLQKHLRMAESLMNQSASAR